MPPTKPLVYILVLHWRGIAHTRACLASLKLLQYGNFKILLVDNGSETSSSTLDGELLKSEFPEIELLRLEENRGFSGGCNAGISYSLEREADYVWLLNNDTTVRVDALSLLVAAAEQNERAAALSAGVLESQQGETSQAILNSVPDQAISQDRIIPGKGILDFRRAKSLLRPVSGDTPVECEWLAASNLLLRARAVRDCNGGKNGNDGRNTFDDRYFLYFEDTELCHRLTLQGWKCVFVPAAKISHVGGASTGDNLQHWRSYYYTRNRLLFFSTYTTSPMKALAMLAIHAHIFRHRLSLPGKGEHGRRQLQAELLGVSDFERGRFGKCTELD